MAKVTIANLNTLLDAVVTSNIAVQTAQTAVTNATVQAGNAATSAQAAALSKSQIDQQVIVIDGLADDIYADVLAATVIKEAILALEEAIRLDADQVTLDRAAVATMLGEVLTAKSGVDVKAELIEELVEDFHTKYLGASSTEPTVSWGGMELATGMIYYDTTKNSLMLYINANIWVPILETVNTIVATNNLADLPDKAKARTNLDVMSTSEVEAQIQMDIAAIKGQPLGLVELDAAGLVPASQLPSYVDDVLEYTNLSAFPATGEAGKIYIALDTNKAYRWSGSTYVYITSGAVDSVAGKTGVVVLVKADVGLANVDNTRDVNKPISTATQTALNSKVDKINGKGLSTEDYTTAEKTKLSGLSNYTKPTSEPISYITNLQTTLDGKATIAALNTEKGRIDAILASAGANADTFAEIVNLVNSVDIANDNAFAGYVTSNDSRSITIETNVTNLTNSKVDKINGKGLSTEDYTTAEKTKLSGIAAGAQVNVPTNLSLGTATGTTLPLNSSTGTDVTLPAVTTTTAGLMGSSDKTKLDGIAANANNYSLPVASASVLGGVKAGTNVSIDANGVISANDSSVAWSEVTSKPTFAIVATSGSYVDLSNKPTIPTTLPASDVYAWAKASAKPSYAYSEITGTPTIPTVPTKVSSFTNDSDYQTSAQVNTAIQAVVGAAPDALNTLEEIATQLANDESAVSALTTTVSGKATKATTLNGYGITDAYTKAEVGTLAELTAILG